MAILLITVIVAVAVMAGCGSSAVSGRETTATDTAPPPQLVSFAPADSSIVGRDISVVLNFDMPMNADSLKRAAIFEPAVSFQVNVSGVQVEFKPDCLLKASTDYRFTLSPDVALSDQEALLETEVDFEFSTRGDPIVLTVPAFGYINELIEGPTADAVTNALGNGVGHFPGLGRPGGGNFVVFAHASGQIDFPYNRLFELRPGDQMILSYGGIDWTYTVARGFVVNQNELWILDQTSQPMITFFVCSTPEGSPSPTFHPLYRYVVRAELSSDSAGRP